MILVIALLGIADIGFAALVVFENKPYVITFDEDIPFVFRAKRGRQYDYHIIEPNSTVRRNSKAGGMLFSESCATSQFDTDGDGTGKGSASRFARDANQNGKMTDRIGYSPAGVRYLDVNGTPFVAYRLSLDRDCAVSGFYLRIQNKTGAPVTAWTFSASYYYREPDSDQFSQLEFSYAVDNSNNPNKMTFIPFGKATPISRGDTIENLAGTLNETVTTDPVEDGNYIVLAFKDTGACRGSDIYIDDIGVTAVKAAVEYYEEDPAPAPPDRFAIGVG